MSKVLVYTAIVNSLNDNCMDVEYVNGATSKETCLANVIEWIEEKIEEFEEDYEGDIITHKHIVYDEKTNKHSLCKDALMEDGKYDELKIAKFVEQFGMALTEDGNMMWKFSIMPFSLHLDEEDNKPRKKLVRMHVEEELCL
jgi:hypothetical protein